MNTVPIWAETGMPRSMGGAFDVLYTARHVAPPELTMVERRAQRNRDAAKARYHARKVKKVAVHLHSLSTKPTPKTRTAKVLTDNTGNVFCTPIATQDDAGKTMRIQGRAL